MGDYTDDIANPYFKHQYDSLNIRQSIDVERYLKSQEEIYKRIKQIAGSQNESYDAYKHSQDQYLRESEYQKERERYRYSRQLTQDELTNNQLEQLRLRITQKKTPTRKDLMEKNILSLNDVQRLTDALSLCIGNVENRESFDTIVKNWIDDQIEELKKPF